MTKYAVQFLATASAIVTVDAEDESAAINAANEAFSSPQLCHQCAHEMDLSDWEPDESKYGVSKVEA